MNIDRSLKILAIAATAALSLGAVSVPMRHVSIAIATIRPDADVPPAEGKVAHEKTLSAFINTYAQDPRACTSQTGGKLAGRSMSAHSLECAFPVAF